MAWSNNAAKQAKSVLNDNGSIFPDLEEAGSRKLQDIVMGQVYNLGRFEVIRKTQKLEQPFVTMELSGQLYSGYATAIANQLVNLTEAAKDEEENKAYVNDRKAWTEVPTELPVKFKKQTSPKGEYIAMEMAD